MKRQLRSSNTDHTRRNQDEVDRPISDPIRDDPETLDPAVTEPPRKKSVQMGEGSYQGSQKYAEGLSNYLEHADVEADTRAAKPVDKEEAALLEKAESEAASRSRDKIKPKLHAEEKRNSRS
jgi:hypothetical protein